MNDLFANLGDTGTCIFKFISGLILVFALLNYYYHFVPNNYIFIAMFALYAILWAGNAIDSRMRKQK